MRVLEGVAGEQDDVDRVREREVDQLIETRGEIKDALVDPGLGIRLAVGVGPEVVVGKVEDGHAHFARIRGRAKQQRKAERAQPGAPFVQQETRVSHLPKVCCISLIAASRPLSLAVF